jgi:hypothetical protein
MLGLTVPGKLLVAADEVIEDDAAPIHRAHRSGETLPPKDLTELVAWLKANPGKATVGIAGVGGGADVVGTYFQRDTGTRFQFVPLYVADCLANEHVLLSSEENGEPLSSLWL